MKSFRQTVWDHYKKHGRYDLPWRKTTDPYKILVSEVMLQQTQVQRVIEKYKEFLKVFPNVRRLARVPLSEVLKVWSGMGYNRRAKFLRDAARVIVAKHKGKVPLLYSDLVELPGIGPYTASAVRAFAFNEPDILVETNIRAAFIHHFFAHTPKVRDRVILVYAEKAAPNGSPPAGGPREWHWALMDYGAHLKRSGVRNNHRSAHYTRQSKFEGSLRQVRGEVIRVLTHERMTERQLMKRMKGEKWEAVLEGLARDGLIVRRAGPASGGKKMKWRIA